MIEPWTCREVAALLTEYLDRSIPWNQRLRTRQHLRFCPDCRRMLVEVQTLPSLFRRFEATDAAVLQPWGEAALAAALKRLGEPRSPGHRPATAVPDTVQRLLGSAADLPLRLLALTHSALMNGTAPRSQPFLPESVLAQLRPVQDWKWRRYPGGIRRALLWAGPEGPSLSLVHMPPDCTLARHTHLGSESLLVLDGELEHLDRCLADGDWIHLEPGSSHAPCALGRGCWCLVRDEGQVHYTGPLGWVHGLMAGA